MREPKIVLAMLHRNGHILLVRRGDAGHDLRHMWGFPGGRIPEGTRPRLSAAAHVLEETGIQVSAGDPILERDHPVTGVRVAYVLFDSLDIEADHYRLPAPVPNAGDGIREAQWFPIDQTRDRIALDGDVFNRLIKSVRVPSAI